MLCKFSLIIAIILASTTMISASGSGSNTGGPNSFTLCKGTTCAISNTSAPAGVVCETHSFHDGACIFTNDDTVVDASCGDVATCVYGAFFPNSIDCGQSGTPDNYNFSSVVAPDQVTYTDACTTLDSASDSGPTWTFFLTDGTNYQVALACGLQCSACIAVSPSVTYGTCTSFNQGSVRIDGSRNCRDARIYSYASSGCGDTIPAAQLPIGSTNSIASCRTTHSLSSQANGTAQAQLMSTTITCAEPLPTTSTIPPTTTAAPPVTTSAPTVTKFQCDNSPDCKQDCHPVQTWPSGQCVNAPTNNASWFSVCTPTFIANKFYNTAAYCMGSGTTTYFVPMKCHSDGAGNGYYLTCK